MLRVRIARFTLGLLRSRSQDERGKLFLGVTTAGGNGGRSKDAPSNLFGPNLIAHFTSNWIDDFAFKSFM